MSTLNLFHQKLPITYGISQRHHGSMSIHISDGQQNLGARQTFKKELGVNVLISSRQVHGTEIAVIDSAQESDLELDGFDALIANQPGVGLMIQQADCQAVMLFDPVKKIVANIHCGWRGSVLNIIAKTITIMRGQFKVRPENVYASISPSLGPCCAEFTNYQHELPVSMHKFQVKDNYFDFWEISCFQLCQAGVLRENINISGVCTVCCKDYFSYRRGKDVGRFASVIGLLE